MLANEITLESLGRVGASRTRVFVLKVYGVSLEFKISCQDLGYVLREVLPKRSPGQWLLYGLRNCVSSLCILCQKARVH